MSITARTRAATAPATDPLRRTSRAAVRRGQELNLLDRTGRAAADR